MSLISSRLWIVGVRITLPHDLTEDAPDGIEVSIFRSSDRYHLLGLRTECLCEIVAVQELCRQGLGRCVASQAPLRNHYLRFPFSRAIYKGQALETLGFKSLYVYHSITYTDYRHFRKRHTRGRNVMQHAKLRRDHSNHSFEKHRRSRQAPASLLRRVRLS